MEAMVTATIIIVLAIITLYCIAKVYTVFSRKHHERVKYKLIKKAVFYARPWK